MWVNLLEKTMSLELVSDKKLDDQKKPYVTPECKALGTVESVTQDGISTDHTHQGSCLPPPCGW